MRAEQRIPIVNVQYDIIVAVFSIDPFRVHRQRKGEIRLVFVLCLAAHADGCVLDIFLGDDVGDRVGAVRHLSDQCVVERNCSLTLLLC